MATSCKFQDFLDEALRDHFVSGIRSSSIQKRLLTEEELTSAAALQLAQSMESAQNSSTKLQGSETPSAVLIILVLQATVEGGPAHQQVHEVYIGAQASLVTAVEVNIYLLTVDLLRLHATNATRKDILQELA